nr:MAG TPA: tail protein [Caudoviricetes sp.]
MINVSNAFREKLEAGEPVRMVVDITFPDGTKKTIDEEIMNGDNGFTDCAESSSFPVGTSVCKTLTLNINNYEEQWKEYDFYSAKIHAYLKVNSLAEKIDKGIYTVTTPEQYSDIINITALDDMYKANKVYTSGLKLPQSLINLVRDACETIGIGMNLTMSHGDIIIRSIPDNMTFRQLFGYAAMVESANARIDYSENLRFIKWDFEKADIPDLKNYGNPPALSSDDIIITGIRVKNGQSNDDTDSEYSGMYGKEGYLLELENELIDSDQLETVASIIGEQIVGARFRNLEGDLVYNPLVEFGDMVYTYDRLGNKYLTPLTDVSGNVGGLTTVKTQADDPIRGSSDYYSEGTKAIVAARQMVKKETSAREEAVKRLEQKISDTNASGMFCTDVRQEDGSTIRYLHDKPTLKESSNVIKVTSEAIGISNDGGKTYPYGITLDGETITRLLYAEGINADYINAGTILVKDKDKNVIFEADMDAGSVYISGNVQIGGGKTLDETLEEFSASAKNMTIQLSNEYQGIPVGSDGNYSSFPECSTQATVMYGAQDITENCSYTITESQNISGSWDEVEHMYTVESLTADSGWVDIRATYLENLSISKRFTIAKQYAGEQGTAGRTYFINADADILLMGADKKITPNILNLRPYYRDGQEDAKNFYAWWTIEKSVDNGSSWEDISTYSTSMKLIQIQLNTLSLEAHDMIRASAYADKEKTILCDQQTFPVALDVSALSQKDIVEILSNNGAWKGLYYLNNELYVSFNAALGGTLTLGGQNNGNGLLILLDDEGSEIGRMSSGGTSFRNSDNNIVIRINKNGMFFYDSTGQKRKVLTDSSGITMYTDYTDANNWKALKIGKYGIYAAEKSGGVEDLWMEGDTSHQWDGYILRFLNDIVRLNANAVYTDGCSMGKNLTTSGTLSVSGNTGLKGDAYVAGNFSFRDYKEEEANTSTRRRPVSSASAALNRVAYLSSATRSNKAALTVSAQWGSSNYTIKTLYNDSASDIRLKENVLDCEINALDAVCKMPVCSFDWKETGVHQPLGLVADDIEKIDPLLALGGGENEDGSMNVKQIDRLLLTEYAIKAIQELSAVVKEQGDKIRELEGKLDGIKGN